MQILGVGQAINTGLGAIIPAPVFIGADSMQARGRLAEIIPKMSKDQIEDALKLIKAGKGIPGWTAPRASAAADLFSAEYEKRVEGPLEAARNNVRTEAATALPGLSVLLFSNLQSALARKTKVRAWRELTEQEVGWLNDLIAIEAARRAKAEADAKAASAQSLVDAANKKAAEIQARLDDAMLNAKTCSVNLKSANDNAAASQKTAQEAVFARAEAEKKALDKIAAANEASRVAAAAKVAAENAAAARVTDAQAASAAAEAARQKAIEEAKQAIAKAQEAAAESERNAKAAKQAMADRDEAQKAMQAAKADADAAIKAARDSASGATGELERTKKMVRNVALGGLVLAFITWRMGRQQ